jgi:hypothetical protein
MAKDLSIVALASLALSAGMDMGFNAVIAARQFHISTDKSPVRLQFGDRDELSKVKLSGAYENARSYSHEIPCIRAPRTVEFDDLTDLGAWTIQSMIREQLLELADGQG